MFSLTWNSNRSSCEHSDVDFLIFRPAREAAEHGGKTALPSIV